MGNNFNIYSQDFSEKKTAESNILATQGSLRQLLRTFFGFCRFAVIKNGLVFHSNHNMNIALLTLEFSS